MATSVNALDPVPVGSSATVAGVGEASRARRRLGSGSGGAPASITCAEICYLVETGGLPVVRLGGEVLVSVAGVADYLARHASEVPETDRPRPVQDRGRGEADVSVRAHSPR
jgi:hypothetical protein